MIFVGLVLWALSSIIPGYTAPNTPAGQSMTYAIIAPEQASKTQSIDHVGTIIKKLRTHTHYANTLGEVSHFRDRDGETIPLDGIIAQIPTRSHVDRQYMEKVQMSEDGINHPPILPGVQQRPKVVATLSREANRFAT